MSFAAKVGAFGGFLRVFPLALPHLVPVWGEVLAALAVATMIVGNLAALLQTNTKRLMAYSSIAHSGYMLIGVVSGPAGTWAVLFYLAAYALMNLGTFGVLLLLERRGEEADRVEDLAGLADRAPWAAGVLALCMVSLAGRVGLALVGVLTSVVSVYYYLRVPTWRCRPRSRPRWPCGGSASWAWPWRSRPWESCGSASSRAASPGRCSRRPPS